MNRRICFPISDDDYKRLNKLCEAKKLTRKAFYTELMAAAKDYRKAQVVLL